MTSFMNSTRQPIKVTLGTAPVPSFWQRLRMVFSPSLYCDSFSALVPPGGYYEVQHFTGPFKVEAPGHAGVLQVSVIERDGAVP